MVIIHGYRVPEILRWQRSGAYKLVTFTHVKDFVQGQCFEGSENQTGTHSFTRKTGCLISSHEVDGLA